MAGVLCLIQTFFADRSPGHTRHIKAYVINLLRSITRMILAYLCTKTSPLPFIKRTNNVVSTHVSGSYYEHLLRLEHMHPNPFSTRSRNYFHGFHYLSDLKKSPHVSPCFY